MRIHAYSIWLCFQFTGPQERKEPGLSLLILMGKIQAWLILTSASEVMLWLGKGSWHCVRLQKQVVERMFVNGLSKASAKSLGRSLHCLAFDAKGYRLGLLCFRFEAALPAAMSCNDVFT